MGSKFEFTWPIALVICVTVLSWFGFNAYIQSKNKTSCDIAVHSNNTDEPPALKLSPPEKIEGKTFQ